MVRTSKFTQQMSPNVAPAGEDLFAVLGVNKDATEVEVRSYARRNAKNDCSQ